MCAAFEKENKPGVRVSELESANETELQGVAVSEKITDSTSALQMFPRDCQLLLIKRIIISHPEKTYLRNGIEGVDPMEYRQWAVLSYEKSSSGKYLDSRHFGGPCVQRFILFRSESTFPTVFIMPSMLYAVRNEVKTSFAQEVRDFGRLSHACC